MKTMHVTGRQVLALAFLVIGLVVVWQIYGQGQDKEQAEAETVVAEAETETVTDEATDLKNKVLADCRSGRPTLKLTTCRAALEMEEVIENVEVDQPEIQDLEIDDPEVQDEEFDDPENQEPEINDLDPNDPDRPDDPDPDDPENQDAELDDPEVQDSEFDDPEEQEPEIQDEEIQEDEQQEAEEQEAEIQEPEQNDPQDPVQSMTFHDLPTEGQTTTCTRSGGGSQNPQYDCTAAAEPAPEGSSSSFLWTVGVLAYLGVGHRRVTPVGRQL